MQLKPPSTTRSISRAKNLKENSTASMNTTQQKIKNGALDILSDNPKIRNASSERIAERLLEVDQKLPIPK